MARFFSGLLPSGTTTTLWSPWRAGRKGDTLAMIAAGCRNNAADPGVALQQPAHVQQATANLERAGGVVVLVLDPHRAGAALRQQWPLQLGRGATCVGRSSSRLLPGRRGQVCSLAGNFLFMQNTIAAGHKKGREDFSPRPLALIDIPVALSDQPGETIISSPSASPFGGAGEIS